MKAGLWWKMSRLIVSMALALTLAQTQTQAQAHAQAQTHAQAQGPRGTGLRQGEALQSPGKKRQRSRECEIDEEDEDEDDDDERPFLTRVFFLAHGWSSAIYKRRNGTSIKSYNKFLKKNAPCMRLPRLCRVDTVKR